jgi:hypothetical protein
MGDTGELNASHLISRGRDFAMTPDQHREGGFVAVVDKSPEKIGIGEMLGVFCKRASCEDAGGSDRVGCGP